MTSPKLRFKEFDGVLNHTVFNEYILSSKYGPRFDANDYDVNGNVKTIRGTDVTLNATIKYDQVPIANLPNKLIEEHQLKNGDILMITTADCGLSAIFEEQDIPFIASAYAVRIILKDSLNSIWSKYYLQTQHIVSEVNKYVRKGTLSNLPLSDISKFNVAVPSLEEQTKIASFLSQVDEKICQLNQKYELLNQYKQGMMQKLFSQQIRFKADDGSEFGEWDTNLIRDVFTNRSKNFNPQIEENLPCIELEHLSQNTGKILDTVDSCEQQSTKNLFEKNSVLFGKLRPYLRKFANPQFKGVCSSEIWVLVGIKISNNYLFQYIQSEQFSELTNIQSGSKMPRADWTVISEAKIEYPCLEEQTKIANFLSAIDQKIEVVSQQIEQAKMWKKGLLQQMFV